MVIESWDSFKEFINTSIKNKKDYYYRGQLDPNWKLQTSFHRYTEKMDTNISEYIDIVLPELQYHLTAQDNELIDLKDEKEFGAFLGKLQHHGFPTPLLDWSLSPYIATHFALREVNLHNPQVTHIKIFIFDYQEWESNFESILNLREDKKKFLSVLRPFSKRNSRIIPQMGSTTVTNVNNIQGYIEEREKEVNQTFLYHVTLPVSQILNIKNELNLMGINEMTLFPGIDGICQHFKSFYFNSIETDHMTEQS